MIVRFLNDGRIADNPLQPNESVIGFYGNKIKWATQQVLPYLSDNLRFNFSILYVAGRHGNLIIYLLYIIDLCRYLAGFDPAAKEFCDSLNGNHAVLVGDFQTFYFDLFFVADFLFNFLSQCIVFSCFSLLRVQ